MVILFLHLEKSVVQGMQLGGNQRARKYFKQHGWDGLGADKIEQKVNNTQTRPALQNLCGNLHRVFPSHGLYTNEGFCNCFPLVCSPNGS